MSRLLSSSDCYDSFNRRIDATDSWIASSELRFCKYSPEAVGRRFRQRCTELALPSFVLECANQFEQSGELPKASEEIDCNGLRLKADGRVVISPRLLFSLLFEFAGHWIHAFLAILLSARLYAKRSQSPITLVYGVGFESLVTAEGDTRFLNYCRRGPIVPLAAAERLAVQSVHTVLSNEGERVRYSRYPLFSALFWRGLDPLEILRVLGDHIFCLASFLFLVLRCPGAIILGRDAAYHSTATALNRFETIGSVVLTNSNYSAQPLWMWALPSRRYALHMVWYSQNSRPIIYTDDRCDAALPNFRFMLLDEVWVWTDSFRDFLLAQGCKATYHVVGPILWYFPESPAVANQPGDFRIAVFDVTPVNAATESRLGLIRNYYSEENSIRFIRDLIDVSDLVGRESGRKIRVILKHKRSHASIHATGYVDLIGELADAGRIVLMSPTMNLYELIDSCDVVVAAPFSSPVYVAVVRGKAAAWYDPTTSLVPREDEGPDIRFIGGSAALAEFLKNQLRQWKAPPSLSHPNRDMHSRPG